MARTTDGAWARFGRGLKRGALFIALAALCLWLTAVQAFYSPNTLTNILNVQQWRGWVSQDFSAFVAAVLPAFVGFAGLAFSLYQVFFSQEAKRNTALVRQDIAGVAKDIKDIKAIVEHLAAQGGVNGAPRDAQSEQSAAEAVTRIFASGGEPARLIRDGKIAEALAALRHRIAEEDRTQAQARAQEWRDIGALTYFLNVSQAIEAYSEAAKLDPTHCWTHIYLSRLFTLQGDLSSAKQMTERALVCADTEREKSAAFAEIGDVAQAEGDLAAARKAFQNSLNIRTALANRDTTSAQAQRDLSVSYNKLGDVAQAEGDLAAAQKAFQNSLDIDIALAKRDPTNAQAQRDLSISYACLGGVAQAEGDLAAARKAFQNSLDIHIALAKRNPTNAQAQRDLSISYERLGDACEAEGDIGQALEYYQMSLPIAQSLAARWPEHPGFARDLRITQARIDELRAKASSAG